MFCLLPAGEGAARVWPAGRIRIEGQPRWTGLGAAPGREADRVPL